MAGYNDCKYYEYQSTTKNKLNALFVNLIKGK